VGADDRPLFLRTRTPLFFKLLKSSSLSLSEFSAVEFSSSSSKNDLTLLCRLEAVNALQSLVDLTLCPNLPRCLPLAFLSKYKSSLSETSMSSSLPSASSESSPSQSLY